MRAVAILLIGLITLPLAWSVAASAKVLEGVTLLAEAHPELAKLTLVWPEAVDVTLQVDGAVARLRVGTPLAAAPVDPGGSLASWVDSTAVAAGGREVLFHLLPGVAASLTRPHPRLALIEFVRVDPKTSPPSVMSLVAPAAGPAHLPPIPASRPPLAALDPEPPTLIAAPADEAIAALPSVPVAVAPRIVVSAETRLGRLDLRIRSDAAAPAAIFRRGDRLWVVIAVPGTEVAGWRSLDRAGIADWIEPLATAGNDGARLFRFRLARPAGIAVDRDATGWSVALTEPDASPPPAGSADIKRLREQGVLQVDARGEVTQIRDPDSGERFGVLMSLEEVSQVAGARLVDLEVLPSLQGVVWRSLADGVRATVADGRLTIYRPGGLRLSAAEPSPPPAVPPPAMPSDAGMMAPTADQVDTNAESPLVPSYDAQAAPLGLATLAASDSTGRESMRRQLIGNLHGLDGLPRAEARLELARLYLADALGPEARTALELIEPGDLASPAAGPQRLSRLAMSGAAEALAGQTDPALAKLLDRSLDEDREVALWRAYAAALASRRDLAEQEWARAGGLPANYPDPLRRRLGFELAATLLDGAEPAATAALLERLRGLNLGPADSGRLHLLQGMARAKSGAPVEAETEFAAATAGGDEDVVARASFLLTSSRMQRGALTPVQALNELVGQRPRWRGNPWESRMLAQVATLQAAHGEPVAAIGSWRDAIARSSEPAMAASLEAELRQHLKAAIGDPTLPAALRLALFRAHGGQLEGQPGTSALRGELAVAAAEHGLTDTAAKLVAAAGPSVKAASAALVRAPASAGRLDPAMEQTKDDPGADVRAKLADRSAPSATDAAGASLAGGGTEAGGMMQREALWRRGDWPNLAALANTELAQAREDGPLDDATANAAVWLGLAQTRLGRVPDANEAAIRYQDRLAGRAEKALLQLAVLTPPVDGPVDELAAATGVFNTEIRNGLAALPKLAIAEPVKTASARSIPGE